MNEHARPPTSRSTKLALLATAVLLLFAAVAVPAYLGRYGSDQQGQKEAAQGEKAQAEVEKRDLAAEVKKACDAGGETAKKLTQQGLCKKATEIIKEPIEGPEGKQGPPPTDEQVQRAVNAYCADGRCNGKSPSPSQVAMAVASYCNARGQCTPPKPKDGTDGEDGQNATAAQVASAVASFCTQESQPCKGDDGADGRQGERGLQGLQGERGPGCTPEINGCQGPAGRGISVSVSDIEGGKRITITYTDGSTPPGPFDIMDGADSTVPGPAGMECPSGYQAQQVTVSSSPPTQNVVLWACVQQEG